MKGLVFTYLMTYGGAVTALFYPFVGLLIYICFAIIRPYDLWFWSVPLSNYSRTIAVALLMGWVSRGCGRWDFGRARAILAALGAYFAWATLGALGAADQEVAWDYVESVGKIALPVLVGLTTIDSVARLKQIAWLIVVSQGYVALELNLSYFTGFNRLHEMGFGSMDNNCFAISLDTVIGLGFFLGLEARQTWQKILALGCVALQAHAVLFSMSRGGMLGMICVGLASFVLIPKRPVHLLMLSLAVVVCLRLAGPEVRQRFSTTFAGSEGRDQSAQSRVELWKQCVRAMAQHPLMGVGPNHWVLVVQNYGGYVRKEAHTLWLQTGAELGVPGLVFLLLFYVVCVVRIWPIARGRQPVPDPWLATAGRMVIASLVGFMVSVQFVSVETLEPPYYVAMLGAGVLKLASTCPPAPAGRLAPGGVIRGPGPGR
ncbi:MAG TPA: O-antigen ligase family protein [Isosphaeraceae bacterium]|jgi:probable O-glycosylation ligase (exosortase A-associated)